MMTLEQEAEVYELIAGYKSAGGVLNNTIHQQFIDQVINAD